MLLTELQEHPRTGTGKPDPLSGGRAGQWSRRISQKHRLVYEIEETIVKSATFDHIFPVTYAGDYKEAMTRSKYCAGISECFCRLQW